MIRAKETKMSNSESKLLEAKRNVKRNYKPLTTEAVVEKLNERTARGESCWLWTGKLDDKGYGHVWLGDRSTTAHRATYETFVGPVAKDQQIDHLCRVRHCVNPAHLEAVSPRENTLRGEGVTAVNARKTHCIRGHEFNEANTYHAPRGRHCRACDAEAKRNV